MTSTLSPAGKQAWEPDLDIDGYIEAVIALIDRFAGPPRMT